MEKATHMGKIEDWNGVNDVDSNLDEQSVSGKITLESVFSAVIIAFLWVIIFSAFLILFGWPEDSWSWLVIIGLSWGFAIIVSIVSMLIKGKENEEGE